MSSLVIIDKNDTRYSTLQKGFNLRWPTTGEGADFIYICHSVQDVIDSANDSLVKGRRITVRSGGHCYEGFVSNKLAADENKPLAIIDISLMTGMIYCENKSVVSPYDASKTCKFSLSSGNQNWDDYINLYKSANRTIPGGSCYSVGAGGHITGGGYGLLSRIHGLTVDWLSGIDILVPNPDGSALVAKHVNLASSGSDRDLFVACRGAPVGAARCMDWLYLTQTINSSGDNQRGKYKSANQKLQFGKTELHAMWNYLNVSGDADMNQMLIQFDYYGGCVNANDETNNPTSVFQRSTLLRAQFQIYWKDSGKDEFYTRWMQDFYYSYFANYGGNLILGLNMKAAVLIILILI